MITLILRFDHWKLADFGLSKLLDKNIKSMELNQSLAGTPKFMAPEILLAPLPTANYSRKIDLFSLGATLHSVCSQGDYCFKSTGHILAWKGTKSTLPEEYSDHLKQTQLYLLQPKAEDRLSAEQMLYEIPKKPYGTTEVAEKGRDVFVDKHGN